MLREEAEKILKVKFRINSFHDKQWETISGLLNNERLLLIERTGFGKSLCYQFPTLLFDGVTIVFSPLIALMRDQVEKLKSLGIPADCLNSSQTSEERNRIITSAINSELKLLYIAPERLMSAKWNEISHKIKVSMVVIDEAHCISTWGHDFRPAYKKLVELISPLPENIPALAVTATATAYVEKDIFQQLNSEVKIIRGSLFRDNLKLQTVKTNSEDEKMIQLVKFLQQVEGNGIVYTGTRFNTEIYSKWLNFNGISSVNYNAGLESDVRKDIENGFIQNKWKAVISTNALGMGIDKSDIRFVIHTQFPPSPMDYYQEIGRAGRDGLDSRIILYYSDRDKKLPEFFIFNKSPDIKTYRSVLALAKKKSITPTVIEKSLRWTPQFITSILEDLCKAGLLEFNPESESYSYTPGDENALNEILEYNRSRIKNFEAMKEYLNLTEDRMKFLCNYLGDIEPITETKEESSELYPVSDVDKKTLVKFRENYFNNL